MTAHTPATPPPGGPLRVLYFGTYDRGVGRNAILRDGLRAAGAEVVECHAPLWRDTDAKLAAARLGAGAAAGALRLAAAWRRLEADHRRCGDYDVMVVGATAHLDLPLATRLARERRRPLVFDPLVSIVETVRDRGLVPEASLRLGALRRLERALFARADRVVVDSRAHGAAFARDLGVPTWRQIVVPAGAPAIYRRLATPYEPRALGSVVSVLYFGQFIPLHGLDVVLRAADALRARRDIVFHLVGHGQTLPASRALAARLDLPNVRFHDAWLRADALARTHIAGADVCLGVFGRQPKADRVVPFKVYTAMASGRAVITGRTAAAEELLATGSEVSAVPVADPVALAAAIRALADDPQRREALARAGQSAYDARFDQDRLGRLLYGTLTELAAASADVRRGEPTGPRHLWRTALLRDATLRVTGDGPVLDAGCGDGSLALALAAAGRCVEGCDRDGSRLRRARSAAFASGVAERVHLVRADVAALPWRDAAFAAATMGDVLEHVVCDAHAVAELARVVAPGGAVAMTVPAGACRVGPLDRAVGHRRRYDRADLAAVMRDAFAIDQMTGWGWPFGRLYDRWVMRPALLRRGSRTGAVARRAARWHWLRRAWLALFWIDARLDAGDRGSGIVLVARRRPTDGDETARRDDTG